jgi:hypothetical protein
MRHLRKEGAGLNAFAALRQAEREWRAAYWRY